MQELGIDILNLSLTLRWDGIEIPMRDFGELRKPVDAMDSFLLDIDKMSDSTDDMQKRVTRILDAKYEKANLALLCDAQHHLTREERALLHRLLSQYEHLFDGTLGEWRGTGVSFELKADAKPFHAKPYPIAHVHERPMKTECDRLVMLGVLEECHESEWAAPTFIIPKKNNTVRFISDFRKLNAALKRKPYPIPKIQDMLQKLEGFRYATALDLNMGYYTIKLNPDAQNLCTIVLRGENTNTHDSRWVSQAPQAYSRQKCPH